MNLCTRAGALDAMSAINTNLGRIQQQLAVVGATGSRFSFAAQNLQVAGQNFRAAAAQIEDIDVAQETANLVREQVLQQAATAVLAQANQQPQLALQLLK